ETSQKYQRTHTHLILSRGRPRTGRFVGPEKQIMGAATTLLKRLLQVPADALIASSKKLPGKISESIIRDPRLENKLYPYEPDQEYFVLSKSRNHGTRGGGNNGLPIPPQDLWAGYGTTAAYFLNSGNVDVATMQKLLGSSGFYIQDGNRLLDFGC